jgi:hypothetical protein
VPVILRALGISLVQVTLLMVCGFGPARLLLPARLRRYELLLAPLFGLSLLAVLGFYGANAGLTLRWLLPIALGIAAALLLAALRRSDVSRLPFLLPARELLPLLLIMAGSWLLHIAPLLNYGALIPIGHNWDVEFYLPLAEYLKDFSYVTMREAPPNPLLAVVTFDRVAARAMGATYAQSLADLVARSDSWDSWVPMLALLRALTLAGLYALLRESLRLPFPAALFGTLLAGANSLLLWTTYNNFGMSVGALALLPGALLCLVVALEGPEWRSVTAAALLLGGITCTYWPMLQTYAIVALACGVVVLWERRRQRPLDVVVRGLGVVAGSVLIGLLAHLRAPVAWLDVFALQTPSMGIFDFVSPLAIAGTAGYSHLGLPFAEPIVDMLGWAAFVAAVVLLLLGLWRGSRRPLLALAIVVPGTGFLLGLRYVVGFPYGLLRGASYANTLLLGLVGAGISVSVWDQPGRRVLPRVVPLVLGAVLLGGTALATYRTYAVYAEQPAVFSPDTLDARALAREMERPGPVLYSPEPELRGTYAGAWAYNLSHHELFGTMVTGFGQLAHVRPGVAPTYAILRRDEDPREYGFAPEPRFGQTERVDVYEAPPGRNAWLSGRPSLYTEGELLREDTTYSRAQIGVGSYLEATPEQPLAIYAGADTLSLEPVSGEPIDRREVWLALATLSPQQVELEIGDRRKALDLAAGLTHFRTGSLALPARLVLHASTAPVVLRWASLEAAEPATAVAASEVVTDTVMLSIASQAQGVGASTRVAIHNPSGEMLKLAIEIYEESEGVPAHYAWTTFPATLAGVQQLDIDLATPAITLDGSTLPVEVGDLRDGRYFAALWVYQGEQVRRRLPFLRFERRDGLISSITPLDLNAAFARLLPLAQPVGARLGDGVEVERAEVSATTARPGAQLQVSLLWNALQPQPDLLLVFVQVLDETDRKIAQWDGAAGGDWWPTPAWQAGQSIRQDIPLRIDEDAPPGTYRVIAGLYDPVTGARLVTPDGQDALWLGTIEVRP